MVDPLPRLDRAGHMTDGETIFDDIVTGSQGDQRRLVAPGDVSPQDHVPDALTGLQVGQRDGDIVRGIDFDVIHPAYWLVK